MVRSADMKKRPRQYEIPKTIKHKSANIRKEESMCAVDRFASEQNTDGDKVPASRMLQS